MNGEFVRIALGTAKLRLWSERRRHHKTSDKLGKSRSHEKMLRKTLRDAQSLAFDAERKRHAAQAGIDSRAGLLMSQRDRYERELAVEREHSQKRERRHQVEMARCKAARAYTQKVSRGLVRALCTRLAEWPE